MTRPTAETLIDIEEISRLKAAYCRYVDTKQWAPLRALFTDDATVDGFGSAPSGSTADQFVAGLTARLTTAVTVHHCHMPEIAFLGPDRARGIWAMMDLVDLGEGRAPGEAPGSRGFLGLGHYEDEYRREGGVWKFCYKRLTRLRVDPLRADYPVARTDLLAHSHDWLAGNAIG